MKLSENANIVFGTFGATVAAIGLVLTFIKMFGTKNDDFDVTINQIKADTEYKTKQTVALDRVVNMCDSILKSNQLQGTHNLMVTKTLEASHKRIGSIDNTFQLVRQEFQMNNNLIEKLVEKFS